MKLFKFFVIMLLAVLLIPIVYQCFYTASIIPYCFLIQVVGCLAMVIFDGEKKSKCVK